MVQQVIALGGVFVSAFLIGFSGAMMPGPMLAVTIEESSRRGAAAGPLIVFGHMLLEAVLVAAVALGLASFLRHDAALITIGLVGGGVMCWMGQDMLRAARHGMSLQATAERKSAMHPVAAGIVVSLANPFWTIWWVTIGMAYILMGLEFGWIGLVVFFCGHILSDLVWYSFISVGVAGGRRFLSDRIYGGMIALCGCILVGFGVWFVVTAVHAWAGA